MGHMNYYIWFMKGYVELSRPIYGLIHNPGWTNQCDIAFRQIKQNLTTAPILRAPDWDLEFHAHTDASAYAISIILTQPGDYKLDYPIYFASRHLDPAEKNYTTTQREKG